MDIRQLDYFITIAKELNLSKAAALLYVSQPALSQYLAKVEKDLDTKLFNRRNHELELTEAGKLYLNRMYKIQHINNITMSKIENIRKYQDLPLRIGVEEHLHLTDEVFRITEYIKLHPSIKITLLHRSAARLRNLLHNDQLDLAIWRRQPESDEMLKEYQLYQEHLALLYGSEMKLTFDQILNRPYVSYTATGPDWPADDEGIVAEILSKTEAAIATDRPDAVAPLLEQLDGFAIVPAAFINRGYNLRKEIIPGTALPVMLAWYQKDTPDYIEEFKNLLLTDSTATTPKTHMPA